MNFKSLVTPGVIGGILAFLGTITIAIGKPALGAFLSDPSTAQTVTAVVTGAIALVAGAAAGVKGTVPTPPAPPAA